MRPSNHEHVDFDVVICGAGLAGLTLARQLTLDQSQLSVALLDPNVPPLPQAAWKVGESTVEFGAYYLADYLRLEEYLRRAHLVKLGLRFFFPSRCTMSDRPEIGLSEVAPVAAYQIDRGILESDLRDIVRNDGATVLEGYQVRRLDIAEGHQPHTVWFTDLSAGTDGKMRCRWLIDASGRRQLIQRQMHLRRPHDGHSCSAAWFRLAGRWDVDDLVPAVDSAWHDRVPDRTRYYSTNHLCGPGYWVWLIPLKGDVTSVGIVARGDNHGFQEFNTYERALAWLRRNEPDLADYIGDRAPLDFRAMKDYSYSSKKAISEDRWACVGEAAFFADPFYSPGTDLIAIANTMTADLIRRDFAGDHDHERVARYSASLIGLNDQLTYAIQHGYAYLGDEMVSLARSVWDIASGWGLLCPQLFNWTFTDESKHAALRPRGVLPIFTLAERARALLDEWLIHRTNRGGRLTFDFFDYLKVPWLANLRRESLRNFESTEALKLQYQSNAELMEGLLQALFLLAVDDLFPDDMMRLDHAPGLNVQRLTLEPTRWDSTGMLEPRSAPRGFRLLYDELRAQLRHKRLGSEYSVRADAI